MASTQAEEAAVRHLEDAYAGMATAFRENNLDVGGIADTRRYFGGLATAEQAARAQEQAAAASTAGWGDGGAYAPAAEARQLLTPPWPLRYADMAPPLPPRCCRILAAPLTDAPTLAAAAAAAAQDVLKLLPAHIQAFCNARSNYHVTFFHTSHPFDPRPDTLAAPGEAGAGAAPDALALPPHQRPAMSEAQWRAELGRMAELVGGAAVPRLEVERVAMARSGTLLLLWTNPDGRLAAIRQQLREAFPGSTAKCAPAIIHSSLFRVLTPEPLPAASLEAVDRACTAWTQKLRGRALAPSVLWFILESEFSSIVGDRQVLPFAQGGAC